MSQPQHSPQETLGYGADTGSGGTDPYAELQPGDRVGKYFVLDVLGRGAMGVVHRAYDPQLERAVALKIVRPAPREDSVARARLLAEARALARVSHPNVVAVYDVGEHEERVYIAMELVDGVDLGRWLKERKRTWQEVVDAFVAAGQGIVAVHDAGMVHRDIKPANVLVGRDGRVRVGDFGIARAHERRASPSADFDSLVDSQSDPAAPAESLTADGLVVGTPAFMAPEQHFGQAVGPAADQYAFCIALHEALYGVRPYAVDARALPVAKLHPPTQAPSSDVPRWLWPLVVRGLQPGPDDRHPSMAALVHALRDDPRRRRRRWIWIGAGVLASAGALALWVARPRPCTGAEQHLEGVWDEPTRAATQSVFDASDRAYAASTWATVAARLDAHAQAWTTMHREACEATRVRGEQSEAMLDRRVACLESRRRELAGVVSVLSQGDEGGAVDHAIEMVGTLRPVDRCGDLEALQSAVAPPDDPAVREQVAEVRESIARARAVWRSGRYDAALEQADAAVERARELGYTPLVVEALVMSGDAHETISDVPAARTALEEAIWTGLSIGHDESVAEAAVSRVWLAGEREREFTAARQWGELGRAVLTRIGEPKKIAAMMSNALGATASNEGRYDDALALYDDAIQRVGDDPALQLRATMARMNIANVWSIKGEPERARQLYLEALAGAEAELGAGHPRSAQIRATLAMVLGDLGRHEEALVLFEEAGKQIEASLGPSPELANVWINEATALNRLGRHDEVIPMYERALGILEQTPDKLALATTLNNLGEIYYNREVFDASRRYYERSLSIAEGVLGPDHPDLAFPLVGLARVLDSENRHRESIEMYERVIRIVNESLGPHRLAAVAYNGIAQVYAEEKRWNEALAALDRETEMVAKMPYVRIDDHLTLATVRLEVLYARGDPEPAIPELVKWIDRAHAEGVEASRVGESELSLAQAQALAGHTADARKTVAIALRHLESSPATTDRVPIARELQKALGE